MHVRTKICDIYDLQKCMMQTWIDFEQNVIEAATDQSDVYMLMADTLNTCCKIVYSYYVVHQNILWNCQCNLVHLMAILYLTLKAEFVFTYIFGVSTWTR